jgi:hypothetical protein
LDPKNTWITEVYKLWTSTPNSILPTQDTGKRILSELLERPYKCVNPVQSCVYSGREIHIVGKPRFHSGIPPSIDHVIRDLIESDNVGTGFNVTDYTTRLPQPGIRADKFLASLMQVQTATSWIPNMRLYGAIDIDVSPRGIGLCGMKPHPYDETPGYSFNPKIKWTHPSWSTVFTPAGCITQTHMDGIGSSQYIIHFSGKKLWLFWPPTEANLNFYSPFHLQLSPEDLTLHSIRNMEGLEVYYLEDTVEAFVVPPNYLHAVIAITTSAHSGVRFCGYDHFEESFRMMSWMMTWAKRYPDVGQTVEESILVVQQLLQEVEWWEEIMRENKKDRRTSQMQKALREVKVDAQDSLKLISGITKLAAPGQKVAHA